MTTPFIGLGGVGSKTNALRSTLPKWWNKEVGTLLGEILVAFGRSDDAIGDSGPAAGVLVVRDDLFLDTASGVYLTALGQNYGVVRPALALTDDTIYRKMIPILAWSSRGTLKVIYQLLTAAFGAQGAPGTPPWFVYEISPNEIVVEVTPTGVASSDPDNSTYIRTNPDEPSAALYGDYLLTDATTPGTDIDNHIVDTTGPTITLAQSLLELVHASGVKIRLEQRGQ